MLRRLHLSGFKAFSSAEIPFEPFTVLIGHNGTGKSTVLQAIEMLGGLCRLGITDYLGQHGWEYSDLPHLRHSNTRIGIEAELESDDGAIRWTLELQTRRGPGVHAEQVVLTEDDEVLMDRTGRRMSRYDRREETYESVVQTLTSSWLSTVDPVRDRKRFPELAWVAGWARGIRGYFFLNPLDLRTRSRTVEGAAPDIGSSGKGLAAFLARLQRRDTEAFDRLVARVKKHYKRLVAIDTTRTRGGWTSLEITERWGKEEATFNARQVSDGLLRLIAVAAMHELPETPSLILLDELEDGLHPALLGSVVEMLGELARDKGVQVIATTHSPITLNYLESGKQILLVHRDRTGAARVTPFSELQDFKDLRQYFDLGEMWYNVGEARLLRRK